MFGKLKNMFTAICSCSC